ncbi:MAG: 2-carboxy-1,4-naphthoquinone phytyltransferase [Cuspidothrix sp.]
MNSTRISQPQAKLWMAAIKPPMYTVAIMPIWVGSAVAFQEIKIFNMTIFSLFMAGAILILAWENISNDVFDAETGIDKNKQHSLVNLTGNKNLMFWIGNLCLGLGLLGIIAIAFLQKDPTVIAIIILCCGLGYMYQGPPFRLGYQGLGETLCFFAFGPLGMSAVYYSQTQGWSSKNLAASVIVGVVTSLVLFCSHFHQVEDDIAAGKKSPIVRLGTQTGAKVLVGFTASIYPLILLFVILNIFPLWTLLSFLSLPFAVKLCRHVWENHHLPDKVSNSKFIAVNVHFLSCLFLGLGFILG